MRRENTFNLVT